MEYAPHSPRIRIPAHIANDAFQILKNDVKPAPELCVERNLTGYNYFTKGPVEKFVRSTAAR